MPLPRSVCLRIRLYKVERSPVNGVAYKVTHGFTFHGYSRREALAIEREHLSQNEFLREVLATGEWNGERYRVMRGWVC